MAYEVLRKELYDFYLSGDEERSRAFAQKCFGILDAKVTDEMTVMEQKCLQYDVISEEFAPVVFRHAPFFYETGVLTSLSDGARVAKNIWFIQANGWVYERNKHLFKEQDEGLWEKRALHMSEKLYLICGPYNDDKQHFNFNNRPFLAVGAKGIYERATALMAEAGSEEEREFLTGVCHGMLALKRVAEKFAAKAAEMLATETDAEARESLALIATTACRVPWEAPKTFYEALSTLAFLRTALGSLEGVGPNTFGRLDKDLISFYDRDVEKGILAPDGAYDLVCRFLLIWDCHYDHDMKMVGYSEHELENTYTLGGCDDAGEPIYNAVTEMFLRAAREEKIIFPKIKCRFGKNSPKAYLDEIDRAVVNGTSTILYVNDDAVIPALLRGGRTEKEARDYFVAGCWGIVTNQERYEHANYLNILKPFEYAVHGLRDKCEKVGIDFKLWDESMDFDTLYDTVVYNCTLLLHERIALTRAGGQIFHKVDRFPIFSSTVEGCLENRAEYTMGGGKYRDDYYLMVGFPNIVDSLLAIKSLVFDKKLCTLGEYLTAVRANWEGAEDLRLAATRCHGWGDGSEEANAFARRFNDDLYAACRKETGSYGGKVHLGHLTYTEIRFWGELTLATPDGRKNGEYFAQGLTPSRLKKIPYALDAVNSMAAIDPSTMMAGNVMNVILPASTDLDRCEAFLRAVSGSGIQQLQLNCVSREQLLDARVHPEKYPDLIVRVTGFSVRFTSLSPEWQDEVISRNFYEK